MKNDWLEAKLVIQKFDSSFSIPWTLLLHAKVKPFHHMFSLSILLYCTHNLVYSTFIAVNNGFITFGISCNVKYTAGPSLE